jgi:beta-lactamase superfamily II metal-dependent hydrolase
VFAQGNGKLQIHHINVGQGDGMLLISPLGQTALFDDGQYLDCSGIKTYLQARSITSVNYHFLSHYHADHLGCIDDLAAVGITIATAGYDRGSSYSSASYTSYVNTLGAKRTTIAKNQVITLDAGSANPVTIKCVELNGAGVYSPSGSDENAKTAVYKVSYGAFDEVIGGDLTGDAAGAKDVETTVGPLVGDVEVYKVHHHGSRYSTNDNWLTAVTAEVGIIQCGNGNSYGHPTADALGRLHAHGVKTYWTETGAGVAPLAGWDKVGGTIVVQADPGVGATYTVSGTGFTDSYTNGGGPPPPPPINTTEVASAVTLLKGSITVGSVASLATNDAVRMSVSAGIESSVYVTDWYGSVTLAHPPLNLTAIYDGNFTISRTQYLYLWNWSTSAWVQINSGTVSTTDVLKTLPIASFAAYVSPTREVRLRVRGSTRSAGSYTCRGDYMAFNYDYASGTAPSAVMAPALLATVVAPHDDHSENAEQTPQRVLRRIEASACSEGIALAWATGINDHVDGFNLYREDAQGVRVHVPGEAAFETRNGEAEFRLVDASPAAGGVYWLAARACSGDEGFIGPIRVSAAGKSGTIAFAAAPNPAREGTRFDFTLVRDGMVAIEVFDLSGRRVATPFAGWMKAGAARAGWDLTDRTGARVHPGIYFARLQADGRTMVQRLVLTAP